MVLVIDDRDLERSAKALREHRNVPGVGDPSPWDNATPQARHAYREEARVVIEAFLTSRANDCPEKLGPTGPDATELGAPSAGQRREETDRG